MDDWWINTGQGKACVTSLPGEACTAHAVGLPAPLAGDYQGALDCIRDYRGAMLDLGATTFREDINLDWTKNAAPIDALVPPGKKDIHGDYGNTATWVFTIACVMAGPPAPRPG